MPVGESVHVRTVVQNQQLRLPHRAEYDRQVAGRGSGEVTKPRSFPPNIESVPLLWASSNQNRPGRRVHWPQSDWKTPHPAGTRQRTSKLSDAKGSANAMITIRFIVVNPLLTTINEHRSSRFSKQAVCRWYLRKLDLQPRLAIVKGAFWT